MIYLVMSANGPYLSRIRPLLQQLNDLLNPEIQPVLVCVDCQPPAWLDALPRVCAQTLSAAGNYGTSESTSVEHGSFLALLPGAEGVSSPGDLIIKADGDMVMQRAFDDEEMAWLKAFPHHALAAVWNARPGDNLLDESRRLVPKVNSGEVARRFPGYESVPCGNGGCWIARRNAYQRLYDCYMQLWPTVCDTFYHYARQQWLVNYSRFAAGLEFVELSPVIHAQGHYGPPPGVTIHSGTAYHYGRPVVFRHKL